MWLRCCLFVSLLSLLNLADCHGDSNGNGFEFLGDELWSVHRRQQCDLPQNTPYNDKDLSCYVYVIDFHVVNVELLSRDPILLVYRGFAKEEEIKAFLDDTHTKKMQQQNVVSYSETKKGVLSSSRNANGTWIKHEEMEGVARLYRKAEKLIPNINFRTGESWQVLSYNPGGHYAPHYDYLRYKNKTQWDWSMKQHGNRIATFLLVLKTADKGGSTVFPIIEMTVKPEAGDVIFWLNMDPDGKLAKKSLHGACPIYEGQKIAATIWLRMGGQDLLATTDETSQHWHVDHLIRPHAMPTRGKYND